MILLALSVVVFGLLNGVVAFPSAKASIKDRIGAKAYGTVFGLASLLLLSLIVWGWQNAVFVPVYEPTPWGWYVNYLLNFIGFLCLGVFLFRGSLRQTLRFPLELGVIFWALGHLFSNGDAASLILFGGFLLCSLVYIVFARQNGVWPTPEVRLGHDGLSVIFGAALYGIMTQLHGALIGVPVFVLTK